MSSIRKLAAVGSATAVITGLATVGVGGLASMPASASPRPAVRVLPGSAVPFTAHAQSTGNVPAAAKLTIQFWLKPRTAAAQKFATAVSSPGSQQFHQYLSPAAYTARFGATAATAQRVETWLRSQGFTAVHADSGRNYVRATATTAQIDAALRTQLRLYRSTATVNAGTYQLRANAKPVSLPAALAGDVLGVTGLDNAAPSQPLARPRTTARATKTPGSAWPCSQYYGQHVITGLPRKFGQTSFPTIGCGYTAAQLRAAYGASNANTGTGETVALVEQGLTPKMFRTLQDYARTNGMPAPSASRYAELSLGKDSCGDPFDGEEQLDVEASYDMAPGASLLVVGGDSCNNGDAGLQALADADVAILNGAGGHPLTTIASNSWEDPLGEGNSGSFASLAHAYLIRAAAEGVGMYFSAGDASGVDSPSSDPYAIAVGGTSLGIGASNNRLFETGWSGGLLEQAGSGWASVGEFGAAGGGRSVFWREPSYQKGVVPASLTKPLAGSFGPVRSVPDISADADLVTGMAVGMIVSGTYVQEPVGGTSLASPLVASMVATAQQGQQKPFGFANPLFYKLSGSNAFFATLPVTSHSPGIDHGVVCNSPRSECGVPVLLTIDDQNPNLFGYTGQVTLRGYDNMTGVGTPDVPNFITKLRTLAG